MSRSTVNLEEGLALLDVGVGFFDADLRLVHCNPAFREMRRYPDDMCKPGVRLDALLRHIAERGDFGAGDVDQQVAERMAEIEGAGERLIERKMADGQILQIRYSRTPSGGLAVMYQDRTAERRAELALRASEERYALVSEAAEEAIYDWHIAEERFFASDRMKRLLGRDWGDQGERDWHWEEIIHPEDLAEYRRKLEAHIAGDEPRWSCEYRLKDGDGAWRWVSDHGTSIRDDSGRATRMVAAIRDITDRIEQEKALAASEERHALVTQATSDGIYDWNVTDDVLYLSDNLKKRLNVDLTVQSSKAWADQIHPEDYDQYVASLVAHFKGTTDAVDCSYRQQARGGGYRWVHDRGVGVRDADGRVTRLVGAIRDITEMRETRAEIDRVQSRLRGSIETIADGILLVDADNKIELFNDRYVQIFRDAVDPAARDEVGAGIHQGRDFFDMIRWGYGHGMFKPHPDGVDGWIAARRKAWAEPVAELELELANGSWILLNERRMSDGGRISVYTDITELKRREADANAARRRFEEAIASISSGFALWDADDRLVICNARYREYFADLAEFVTPGAVFNDIIAAGIERGLFPLAEGDVEGYLAGIAEKRRKAAGEPREQFISGLWLQITDHRTADGGIVSIYTDITELKTKQMEVEKQSAILRLTMENMGQGITLVDKDLRTIALNQKFLELLELPEEFGSGFTMEQAFRHNAKRGEYGPGDIEQQARERLELAAKFLPHKFERTRPDGTVIEIVGNPIEGGGFVSTYTDITERKQAEQALRSALDDLNTVLDNIDYGVILLDSDLRLRLVNPVLMRQWGFTEEFIAGRPTMRELIEFNRDSGRYIFDGDDWDAWVEDRVERVKAGAIAPIELARTDGSVLRYQCFALPDGGRMLTYFDISEMKEREAEVANARDAAEAALEDLRKAQQRLVQSEKMASLGQLTAGIAHEIKNPLNFVNNFARLCDEMLGELAEILKEPIASLGEDDREDVEDLLETVRENLVKINQHGRRADSIVKNMLLHSREGPSERQRVALNPIAEEALNLAYHAARAEDSSFNIEMQADIDPAVGEIDCYPHDLMRVFLNLITNGMYAVNKRRITEGEDFSPTLSLATRANGDSVEIEVRDNGVGIPSDVREKIFLPFFTTKPAGEGTGLGLSLSYDIVVKQHGGSLTVDSVPGQNTTFVVSIPAKAEGAGA